MLKMQFKSRDYVLVKKKKKECMARRKRSEEVFSDEDD